MSSGSILVSQLHTRLTTSLIAQGLPRGQAAAETSRISQSQGGTGSIPHFVRLDFAYATRTVLYAMAGIMAVATIVAVVGRRRGLQEAEAPEAEEALA